MEDERVAGGAGREGEPSGRCYKGYEPQTDEGAYPEHQGWNGVMVTEGH